MLQTFTKQTMTGHTNKKSEQDHAHDTNYKSYENTVSF